MQDPCSNRTRVLLFAHNVPLHFAQSKELALPQSRTTPVVRVALCIFRVIIQGNRAKMARLCSHRPITLAAFRPDPFNCNAAWSKLAPTPTFPDGHAWIITGDL
ncbi:MAG: hypothetical protein CMJ19_15705 [Phycisphaeraceae bacterium]|nr:hypothetical protein [Phycisphaeraceae bacterium]